MELFSVALKCLANFDRVIPSSQGSRKNLKATGECRECGIYVRLRKDGQLYKHADGPYSCYGSGLSPRRIKTPCLCGKPVRINPGNNIIPIHNDRRSSTCGWSDKTATLDSNYKILFST